MAEDILKKIIKKKIEKIEKLKSNLSLENLQESIDKNKIYLDFKSKIQSNIINGKYSIIAEIKKASPSGGIIVKNYDPVEIANVYDLSLIHI